MLEKAIYIADVTCAFVFGLVVSLRAKDAYERFEKIGEFLGYSPLAIVAAVVLAAAAEVGAAYLGVRLARHHPITTLLVKLSVLALPGVAVGYGAAIGLVGLGVVERPPRYLVILAINAVLCLCAGIAGIATTRLTPEYNDVMNRVLQRHHHPRAGAH